MISFMLSVSLSTRIQKRKPGLKGWHSDYVEEVLVLNEVMKQSPLAFP
jgi:hypothetical protein